MRTMFLAFVIPLLSAASLHAQSDSAAFAAMRARSVGPAGMSGRVAAIDAVVSDPNIIYVGAATGGLWKSVDGGLAWEPLFDSQHTSSIGAVAIFQSSPDIVWVGTGEGNPRNSQGVGYGVYKSLDGGRTWKHLGLERSEHIHRIVLDPTDPNIAYVAALGPTWSDGDERGVFKTTDGGKTWQRVLFVNERTGAADLVMDPTNPRKLIAAMWEHRRLPWFFTSGGPGSGLYVTYDGGATWKRYTTADGLPAGDLGRVGLAIAPGDPRVVYALVEATRSVLLRSDDGGQSWRTVNREIGVAPRPFYYADLRVDPANENRLYSIHGRATVSEDAGKTFRTIVPSALIHGDVHELWIHPRSGRLLIMGNDGGVGLSYDRGAQWRFVENLPLAQFYHINVDMDTPFNVYGGMQDNGSWFGPSAVWRNGGIRNYYWTRVGGGDGFATLNDFANARFGYSMSQQGFLRRFDKVTGERKDIRPVHPDDVDLRFNWNAAINVDPFDSATIYFGSQFVHRTRDGGGTWEIISPDLTTNDRTKQRQFETGGLTIDNTGAENHTTILTIAPSPVERGVLWVGTDDGNVQLTRDGGATWNNVVGRIRGVPPNTWVPHIEPSKFDGGTAFAVFDDHRRGNWTPYVFKTADYGRSWQRITTDEIWGFLHTIEQDPVERNLLWLGTEFGLFLSLTGGAQWMRWTHGVPTVPVRAILVHPRDNDLVIGTHGRGAFILDDIGPLRALAREPSRRAVALHVFDPPPAWQHEVTDQIGYRSTGHAMFAGDNRPYGALVSYWRGGMGGGTQDSAQATIEIVSGDSVVRTLEGPAEPGMNRIVWNLRYEDITVPTSSDTSTVSGPEVVPGAYTVRVIVRSDTATATLEVPFDPRAPVPVEQRRAKVAAQTAMGEKMEIAAHTVHRLRTLRKAADDVKTAIDDRDDGDATALGARADSLQAAIDSALAAFVDPPDRQGIFGGNRTAVQKLQAVYFSLGSSFDAPTTAQRLAMARAESALRTALDPVNGRLAGQVAEFRRLVREAGLEVVPSLEPIVFGETAGDGR